MAEVKYTKNEYIRLQKKHGQLTRYLPTLQLKKMLLQVEVTRVQQEIINKKDAYESAKDQHSDSIKLLAYPFISRFVESLEVEKVVLDKQNIAGVEIPVIQEVVFKQVRWPSMHQPVWSIALQKLIQHFQHLYREILISKEKKHVLQRELRSVSIRVNLFEKRLIPELERDMNKIKVFIDDAAMQAVSQAKVAKEKILERRQKVPA